MGTFTFELERNYVVLACVSVAAYAGDAPTPAPAGRGWLGVDRTGPYVGPLYLGRVAFFIAPLGPSPAFLVFGLFLVLRPEHSRDQAR